MLGICNGFQIAAEAGLLPGALMRNAKLKFVCGDVHLKVETSQSLFTNRYQAGQVIRSRWPMPRATTSPTPTR